jgi:TolB protein
MKKFFINFIFILFATRVYAGVEVDITRGNLNPLPSAISDFYLDVNTKLKDNVKKINLEHQIPELISKDLTRSGLFLILDRNSYIQKPDLSHTQPRFEDWALIKAQILVTGKISLEKDDRLRVEFRLWDIVSNKELLALAFYTTPDNWRRVSHLISDKIYERLTGESGYFDSRIIYVAESGPKTNRIKKLAIMDQDGYANKYLTLGNEIVLTPRFSPDNKYVTYMSYYKNLPRVYLLNLETGLQDLVGDFPGMTFAPRFSPDGKKIIMSFAKDGNSDIYAMNLKTRIVERLTDSPAIDTSPSYSPDGNYICFNSDRSGSQQIYVMKSDGSNVKRISFGDGIYGTPVWSPRGDVIAFTKFHNNKFYIGVMRTDGSGERLLTENFYQESPSWSPNGRVIIFYRETPTDNSGHGGSAKLWSIDLTGYNEKIIQTPTDASDPYWSALLSKK